MQWLAKGALVLRPNYRGSAGYGERFRSLNVRNLGVGDAWDVESGVEHLVRIGVADSTRVGAMGWSQGGYISAFLATTSTRFRAISVGAGISNWMTYYVNTDITPFTRQYLQGTPWDDPEIYAKTSPMTYIRQARTPTLIQHGEFDQRVPTPNAWELYRGLSDVGVDTRLIIYRGFGHGINKPREHLAALWHNWEWFGRHLWGEDVVVPAGVGATAPLSALSRRVRRRRRWRAPARRPPDESARASASRMMRSAFWSVSRRSRSAAVRAAALATAPLARSTSASAWAWPSCRTRSAPSRASARMASARSSASAMARSASAWARRRASAAALSTRSPAASTRCAAASRTARSTASAPGRHR
jgi:dienelactone hydrolase